MKEKSCNSCLHWEKTEGKIEGRCVRYPPQFVQFPGVIGLKQPLTEPHDYRSKDSNHN